MEIKVTFSEVFMKALRACAETLNDEKAEGNPEAPFGGFVLTIKKDREGDPFKVFSAEELGVDSENEFYLYK